MTSRLFCLFELEICGQTAEWSENRPAVLCSYNTPVRSTFYRSARLISIISMKAAENGLQNNKVLVYAVGYNKAQWTLNGEQY